MDPPHAISRLARLAQPLPLWRFAPAFPHLVVLMVDAGTPPELPPGLREQYLAGMRSQLGLLATIADRSEEHTSELQSQSNLVCRLLLEKKKKLMRRCARREGDTHDADST